MTGVFFQDIAVKVPHNIMLWGDEKDVESWRRSELDQAVAGLVPTHGTCAPPSAAQ